MFGRQERDVLVVGAGPVGLCSALYLADQGIKVEVLEEQWRGASRSYGLALHSASLRLFRELGIADRLIAQGNRVESLSLCDSSGERRRLALSEVIDDFPFVLVMPQQALEDALREELKRRGVKLLWNHRVADLEPGEEGVKARVERLGKESAGYSVARTEWVVEKSFQWDTRFVIGADGHRSSVRRTLEIDFVEERKPTIFAVFEFDSNVTSGKELKMVLREDSTNVLWPMKDGRFRWSFQLEDLDEKTDPRIKSRLFVQVRDESYPYLEEQRLAGLIEERAPWFDPEIKEILWSAAVRFERRLAGSFGKGRVWLVGDAAHLAFPVGIQSMNIGFQEARDLSLRIADVLKKGAPADSLEAYDESRRGEWKKLLALSDEYTFEGGDGWLNQNASRIIQSIPASGEDLMKILAKLGG